MQPFIRHGRHEMISFNSSAHFIKIILEVSLNSLDLGILGHLRWDKDQGFSNKKKKNVSTDHFKVSEFELYSHHIHSYPWESYEPLYPASYGLNSITTVLQGWLWH